jgi:hypothetical protein
MIFTESTPEVSSRFDPVSSKPAPDRQFPDKPMRRFTARVRCAQTLPPQLIR